jgi:hypothetical protein
MKTYKRTPRPIEAERLCPDTIDSIMKRLEDAHERSVNHMDLGPEEKAEGIKGPHILVERGPYRVVIVAGDWVIVHSTPVGPYVIESLKDKDFQREYEPVEPQQTVAEFWKNHPDPTGHDSQYDPLG